MSVWELSKESDGHTQTMGKVCFLMLNFLVQSESTLDLEIKATQKSDLLFVLSTADCVWSWWEIASNVIFWVVKYFKYSIYMYR